MCGGIGVGLCWCAYTYRLTGWWYEMGIRGDFEATARRKHVVIILWDDLGYGGTCRQINESVQILAHMWCDGWLVRRIRYSVDSLLEYPTFDCWLKR